MINHQLDLITGDAVVIDIENQTYEFRSETLLYFSSVIAPFGIQYEYVTEANSPFCAIPRLRHVADPNRLHPARIILPPDNVLRKIEIWGEHVADPRPQINKEVVCENTLLMATTSGRHMMLYHQAPGTDLLFTMNEERIAQVLDSGRHYLRHILD
ncbi:MAG: hypothetical protein JNL57_00170 [Bacteroidetes bacterium]|nr:hypothetical protein [Bacteroidota bacterium]